MPPEGAQGPGSRSCVVRWLDETGGEGSGIFEYETRRPWDKEESIALNKVVSPTAELVHRTGQDGVSQWLTPEALATQGSTPAVESSKPDEVVDSVRSSTHVLRKVNVGGTSIRVTDSKFQPAQ